MSDKNPPVEDAVTVRDLFAAAALVGMLASGDEPEAHTQIAIVAFQCADAMLKERAK